MLDAENILRKAIFDTLKTKYTTFEDVPDDASLPYVVIGQSSKIDDSTKTTSRMCVSLNLHVFSDYQGFHEVAEIVDDIIEMFDKTRLESEDKEIWIFIDEAEITDEPPHKHAIIRLKTYIHEGG